MRRLIQYVEKLISKSRGSYIYKSKDDYRQELVEELEREEKKENLFGVVKRMG